MNKTGIFFGYWSREWGGDFKYYIKKAASLGYDILEVTASPFLEMSEYNLSEIKKTALDNEIELTFCIGFPHNADISSEDTQIRSYGIEYAKRLLETIHKLGGKVFAGINYGAWHGSLPMDADKRPYMERSSDSLRKIAATAENLGILYCLEVVNRFEQFMLNTAEEAISLVKEVNSPNVKILLDTFHMNIEEDSIYEAIIKTGNMLGHFHVGENNRKPAGFGKNIQWNEIFSALRQIEYKGRIVSEPFIKSGGEVGENICLWRDLSNNATENQMDDIAKKSLDFIKAQLDN